jgi:hypothetical protein
MVSDHEKIRVIKVARGLTGGMGDDMTDWSGRAMKPSLNATIDHIVASELDGSQSMVSNSFMSTKNLLQRSQCSRWF